MKDEKIIQMEEICSEKNIFTQFQNNFITYIVGGLKNQ